MNKQRLITLLIALWQLIFAVYTTNILAQRIIFIIDPLGAAGHPEFPMTIEWIIRIFLVVYSPVAVAVFIGLLMRKNWGRILSIFSSGLTALFVLFFLAISIVITYWPFIRHFSTSIIVPFSIMLILILLGVFSFIFLTRPRVKELFQKKDAQA